MSVAHSLAFRVLLVHFLLPALALAQGIEFQTPVDKDPAELDRAMASLARQVMAAPERRTGTSARDLIWIETAAGWYAEAQAIIDAGRPAGAQFSDPAMAPIELYVRAKAQQADLAQLFAQASTNATAQWFTPPHLERLRDDLYGMIEKHRNDGRIALADAVDLCRRYVLLRVYEAVAPLSGNLVGADRAHTADAWSRAFHRCDD